MLLKTKRDLAELDRNSSQKKLVEVKALINRLEFLNAPASSRIRAKHTLAALQVELHKHMDRLSVLRAQVSEREQGIS